MRLLPTLALAHYRHAALLSLSGRFFDEAISELAEAIRRDPRLKRRARKDPDFAILVPTAKFRALVGLKITPP